MNSDLYNFHTRLPQQQQFQPPTTSSSPSRSIASSSIFCRSWNNGSCALPYCQCRYRHRCEKCEGEHPCVNCPLPQHHLLSAHGPLALHGANARGVETVTRLSTSPTYKVNSLQLSRSVSVSHGLFLLLWLRLLPLFRHQVGGPRDSLLIPRFPVRTWLPIPFKVWPLRLGLHPLLLTNCGENFVFTKSKWTR